MRYLAKFLTNALSIVTVIAPVFAANDNWNIDPDKSSIDFSVKFLGVGKASGNFSKLSGTAKYNPRTLSAAEVNANIDISTIDTKIAKRDAHLRTKDFFDVPSYPLATFTSSKIIPENGKSFKIEGMLSMHGITKQVTLDAVRESESANDMVAVATSSLDRNDFGIGNGLKASGIGNKVNLKMKIHLIRDTSDHVTLNQE